MVMSTYGQLTVTEGQKDNVKNLGTGSDEITFKYTEVFSNHFQYRDAVDDHNNKRHDGYGGHQMSLETTWKTTRWELHRLACELVHNKLDKGDSPLKRAATRNTNRGSCHELISAPPYGKFVAGKWHKHYKTKYQQHHC
eukprot:13494962-Ditylum_brightwellii.AAC.1